MRALPECRACLERLIDQATGLATEEPRRRQEAARLAREVLDASFGDGAVPARIATRFHEVIKQATGNPDPFAALKRREVFFAREMAQRLGLFEHLRGAPLPLREAALLAVAGNALDFFREHEVVRQDFLGWPPGLAVDDLDEALAGLRAGQSVLYLADNAGEQFFDAPLLAALIAAGLRVTYAVKGRPVQNDLTLADLEPGLPPPGVGVVSTGGAAVGLERAACAAAFLALLDSASLVVAKGMGHYETIDELRDRRVLMLLKAKCRPVAEGLGVAKDALVARLINP